MYKKIQSKKDEEYNIEFTVPKEKVEIKKNIATSLQVFYYDQ